MNWFITVIASDGTTILFAGSSRSRGEVDAVAAESSRLRPGCRVLIRPPMGGAVYQ